MAEGTQAAALDALGDPQRRAIVELLSHGPSSVQAIADRMPISRPAVSRHLRLLAEAELVVAEAEGTKRCYQLRPDGVEAVRAYFDELWGQAASRFRLAVENIDPRPMA